MSTSALSGTGRKLITTFGLGDLRPAPGTWGSMPPVLLAGAIVLLLGMHGVAGEESLWVDGWPAATWVIYHAAMALTIVVFSWACLRYGDAAEARFNKKDPGNVCADETAGMCMPLMFLPAAAFADIWRGGATLVLAFLAFRVFDILKLPPARGLQNHQGGVGILLDDLVAGAQAMIAMQVIARVLM